MKDNNLIIIRDLFQHKLKNAKIEIIEEAKDENGIKLIIIPDFLAAYISNEEISISYEKEEDVFWKETYSTDYTWVNDASQHAIIIATHILVVDFYYSKLNQKMLYYKIWVVEENGNRKLLKKVSKTLNPFALWGSKAVITKVLGEDG